MKAHLMFKDKDFNKKEQPLFKKDTLVSDLELQTLLSSMAQGDEIILEVAGTALLSSLQNKDEICYRQSILRDCIKNPNVVRELYTITIEAIECLQKRYWWLGSQFLSGIFSSSVNQLQALVPMLTKLREQAEGNIDRFESEGFIALFSMLQRELDDDYIASVSENLNELELKNGMLISSRLGNYNQGVDYVLRRREKKHFWFRWRFAPSFTIDPRDESGGTDLSSRRDRAINEAANILAQSAEHVKNFFEALRIELAFYVGCLNLYDQLKEIGLMVCFPKVIESMENHRSFCGLYDLSLALHTKTKVVGNDLFADRQSLYIVTGANQGGKSTFLRSIGQSQLMMQCGLFVAAESYMSHICKDVFTHFKKEEDKKMNSGKLDEELERMSSIVDHIRARTLILFNESFSATNEREGSEIGSQIVTALIENKIEVFFVTHLFEFANGFYEKNLPYATFLRAERLDDGNRTFRIILGEPLKTSFGGDLYKKIFNAMVVK